MSKPKGNGIFELKKKTEKLDEGGIQQLGVKEL